MGGSLQSGNPLIVSAFHTALFHQLLVVLGVCAVLAIAYNVVRTVQYRRLVAEGRTSFPTAAPWPYPEPAARRVLRLGFGLLWLLDGLLQLQTAMPVALPDGVLRPAAATSPTWVQHLVGTGATIWSNHPVQAAAATVWIQAGLGLWLLVAPRGLWSRGGGLGAAAWGLVVWVFGEAFGGLFAPGLTLLFGAPGAVVFYVVAGVLLALPDRSWEGRRLGRRLTVGAGAFLLVMAVLQAWPGRGFWQGRTAGPGATYGTLAGMVRQMSTTPQPRVFSSWVSGFASFDAAHGWAVNLAAVLAMAGVGAALLSGRRALLLPAAVCTGAFCLADWILIEDLGFFGGVGTDPNSMLPFALLVVAAVVAVLRPATVPDPAAAAAPTGTAGARWWDTATPSYLLRTIGAVAAVGLVLVGTAPMALAATNPNADPVVTEALNGTPDTVDVPAPAFHLVDQAGRPVSLETLRGHAVALAFLDPVCTSDCPLIAQEFRQADQRIGSGRVDFVAVVANPVYRSLAFTNAFDRQEGLTGLRNWLYLTGTPAQLRAVWDHYGVLVQQVGAGAMIDHSDLAFVIDPEGRERAVLADDPGAGGATSSSFASLLTARLDQLLPS